MVEVQRRRDAPWVASEVELFGQLLAAKAPMPEMMKALQRTQASIAGKRKRMAARVKAERSALSSRLAHSGGKHYVSLAVGTDPHGQGIVARMEARAEPPGALRIPLLELKDGSCHYVLGKTVLYCGLPVATGTPYCRHHCNIVYQR